MVLPKKPFTWPRAKKTQHNVTCRRSLHCLIKKKKKRLDKICLRWSLQIRQLNCCLTRLSFECCLGNVKVHLTTPWSTVTNYHNFFFPPPTIQRSKDWSCSRNVRPFHKILCTITFNQERWHKTYLCRLAHSASPYRDSELPRLQGNTLKAWCGMKLRRVKYIDSPYRLYFPSHLSPLAICGRNDQKLRLSFL